MDEFFTCYWQGKLYEYNRMPNGYAQVPFLFTKLLKQPSVKLRKQGLLSVIYLLLMTLTSRGLLTLVVSTILMPQRSTDRFGLQNQL